MGIQLVKEALLPSWAGLTPFARLVLVQMASTAYDETRGAIEGRLYYGGHGFIGVMLLGIGDGDPDWPTAQRRIRRAVRELLDAGAVELLGRAVNGSRNCYTITTNRAPLPVDNPIEIPAARPDQEDISVPLRRTSVSPSGGHQCPPQEDISVPL